MHAIVERGIRDGSLRPVNARLLVFALLGMANWVYQWYDPAGAWDADAIADAFVTLAESGYLATKGSRERDVAQAFARIEAELARLRPVTRTAKTKRRGKGRVRRSRRP